MNTTEQQDGGAKVIKTVPSSKAKSKTVRVADGRGSEDANVSLAGEAPLATPQDISVEVAGDETVRTEVEVIVIRRFKDMYNHDILYGEGECHSFDPERAEDLVNRCLAKYKTDDEG
jgi:hypothetical protein